ncbi:MAG: hypothetical protein LUO83_08035 [Methanothrix sp.]|nr:hypothetical protein [Methanothrix sp.]
MDAIIYCFTGRNKRLQVAAAGGVVCPTETSRRARRLGRVFAQPGYILLCNGRGVMEAACGEAHVAIPLGKRKMVMGLPDKMTRPEEVAGAGGPGQEKKEMQGQKKADRITIFVLKAK